MPWFFMNHKVLTGAGLHTHTDHGGQEGPQTRSTSLPASPGTSPNTACGDGDECQAGISGLAGLFPVGSVLGFVAKVLGDLGQAT